MTETHSEAWARRWCAAMSSGDVEQALAFYASDVEFEDVPFRMKAAGAGFLPVMDHFVGSGNNVFEFRRFSGGERGGAVESLWRSHHVRDFLGVPAAGKRTEVPLVTVMTFNPEGLISRHCDYWDANAVLAQLRD
jgi:steroid delta-isomerase-like uncharacterized protein